MTAQKFTTKTYQTDHSTFGGKIYDYDYNGKTSMCDIASRIESDWKFDKKCRHSFESLQIKSQEEICEL